MVSIYQSNLHCISPSKHSKRKFFIPKIVVFNINETYTKNYNKNKCIITKINVP